MRNRPRILLILSGILVAIALSFPIQIWMRLDEVPLSFLFSLQAYSPLSLLVMITALFHARMIYDGSRTLVFSGALFTFLALWNNWLVAELDAFVDPALVWASATAVLCLNGIVFLPAVRKLLFNPGLRWWRTAPRTKVAIQAVLYPVLGGELRSRTFDLSLAGAFVPCDWVSGRAQEADAAIKHMAVGNHCAVKLKLDTLTLINCTAQVVRRTTDSGQYPSGVGLKFVHLDSSQKQLLKSFLSQHAQVSTSAVAA